ncbi:hypothetical protein [Candidatus Poriferisodalis sp.]|uniref:hypothetical protein n=1 Tax=Candidatus Poriferisodalis sp. TaxID=3101277 RepID=UPI003AF63C90
MTAVEVFLHEAVSSWLRALSNASGVSFRNEQPADGIERLVLELEQRGRGLSTPQSKSIRGTELDLHELRWPDMSRGRGPKSYSGVPVVRLLYAYCTAPSGEVALVVLAGNKLASTDPNAWYDDNVTEAKRRLHNWCDENPPYQPIMKRDTPGTAS